MTTLSSLPAHHTTAIVRPHTTTITLRPFSYATVQPAPPLPGTPGKRGVDEVAGIAGGQIEVVGTPEAKRMRGGNPWAHQDAPVRENRVALPLTSRLINSGVTPRRLNYA